MISFLFLNQIKRPKFGKLIELSNQSYINEIDNEKKNVTVIIHIYDGVSV
jgi:hypothetical protein